MKERLFPWDLLAASSHFIVPRPDVSLPWLLFPAGHVVYRLNEQGLIQLQGQTWSISPATALAESFTPTPGPSDDIKQRILAG